MPSHNRDSIPDKVEGVIRQVAGNSQEINFNQRLDEIYKFHQKSVSECQGILKDLEQNLEKEFGNSMKLDGSKRPACIIMYYEKNL